MSTFITDIWVIPLLPLAALLINLLVIRPIDVSMRDRAQAHDALAAHEDERIKTRATTRKVPMTGSMCPTSPRSSSPAMSPAIDTIDGHVDTAAALPRAFRVARRTSGGQAAVALIERNENELHHGHAKPTFAARVNAWMGIGAMAIAFAWSIGVLFALFSDPAAAARHDRPYLRLGQRRRI